MKHILLALSLVVLAACTASSPAPKLEIRAISCSERFYQGGEAVCSVSLGKSVTLLLDTPDIPPQTQVRIAALGPDGTRVFLDDAQPFQALNIHTLDVPKTWIGNFGRLEILSWIGEEPNTFTKIGEAIEGSAAGVAWTSEPVLWSEGFSLASLKNGSEAQACLQGYFEGKTGLQAVLPCQRAFKDQQLPIIDRLRMGNLHGLLNRRAGDYKQAIDVLTEVVKLAQKQQQVSRSLVSQRNLADVYTLAEMSHLATPVLQDASVLAESVNDLFSLAKIQRKQGDALLRQGVYSQAEKEFVEAIALSRTLGDEANEAAAHLSLGVLYGHLGDPQRALSQTKKAAPFYERRGGGDSSLGAQEDWAHTLITLGWLQAQLLRREMGKQNATQIKSSYFAPALEILERIAPNSPDIGQIHLHLSDMYRRTAKLESAKNHLTLAKEGPYGLENDPSLLSQEGELLLLENNPSKALELYEKLEKSSDTNLDVDWNAAFGKARAYALLGKVAPCRQALELAMTRLELSALQTAPWSERGWYVGEREELYQWAEDFALAQGEGTWALELSERSRGVSASVLLSRLRFEKLATQAPEKLAEFRAKIESLNSALLVPTVESLLPQREQKKLNLKRKEDAQALRRLNADLARLLEAQIPLNSQPKVLLSQLKSHLMANRRILVLSQGQSAIHAWLLSPNEAPKVRVLSKTAQELQVHIQKLRASLLQDNAPANNPDAQALASAIFGPWEEELVGTALTIIPVAAFFELPFAGIPLKGELLLHQVDLGLSPSLSLWIQSQQNNTPIALNPPVIVGDPSRDLAATALEAQRVASYFPKSNVFLGDQARRKPVLAALSASSLFHFAGHALPASSEAGSRLRLSQGDLAIADILSLSTAVDLAFLSGCETGGGTIVSSGELHSLPSAFLRGGSKGVIATFWPIRQGAASGVVDAFYDAYLNQGLGSEKALSQALRQAERGELGANARRPSLWAGFALWGGDSKKQKN